MRKLPAFLSGGAGTLSLLPFIQGILKDLLLDRLVQVVGPMMGPLVPDLIDYGPAVVFGGLTLYFLISPNTRQRLSKRVNWYLLATVLFSLLAAGAFGLFWYDRSRGPIVWVRYEAASPLAWANRNSGPLYFSAFQIKGRNRSNEPILPTEAYIQSNITGLKVSLTFQNAMEVPKSTIEPHADFLLLSTPPWLNPASEPSVAEFKREFASFTLVFKCSAKNYEVRFDQSEVDALIEFSERQNGVGARSPTVTPRR